MSDPVGARPAGLLSQEERDAPWEKYRNENGCNQYTTVDAHPAVCAVCSNDATKCPAEPLHWYRVLEALCEEYAGIVNDLARLERDAIDCQHNGMTLWCRFCRASADTGDVVHHDDCVMARAVRSSEARK